MGCFDVNGTVEPLDSNNTLRRKIYRGKIEISGVKQRGLSLGIATIPIYRDASFYRNMLRPDLW
jgi:hypothetical protein